MSWRHLRSESWGLGTDLAEEFTFTLGREAFKRCAKKSFIWLVASVLGMKASRKVRSSAACYLYTATGCVIWKH